MKKYMGTFAVVLALALAGCGSGAAQTAEAEKTEAASQEAVKAPAEDEKGAGEAADAGGEEAAAGTAESAEDAAAGAKQDDAILNELAEKKGKKDSGKNDEKPDLFAEMAGWEYEFTSGVGAWSTELTVNEDGTFSGTFHDANMGETGEGYEENGTLYYSEFMGKFGEGKELEPFIYEVPIEEINYKNEPETERIEDGTKYIYSEAYGLSGADSLIVYLPGTPIEKLDPGYMDWITMLHFREYVRENSYQDLPEDLPFCGIYQREEQLGFFSWAKEGKNRQYMVNRYGLPGLVNEVAELREDGTYHYLDRDPGGMVFVDSYCFETSPTDLEGDSEAIGRAAIGRTDEGEDMHDFYCMDYDSIEYMADVISLNGESTRYAFWDSGSGEDLRNCSARILISGDYTYVYIISVDADEELFRGEGVHFYLSSLTLSGKPDKLSSASPLGAEKKIPGYAKADKAKDTLLVDEVTWVSGGDTETLARYGIDPEDVTNDYAIVDADGDYRAYQVAEGAPCYVQYPRIEKIHGFVTLDELRDYLGKHGDEKLMELILDKDDKVTFIYEPYTP